MTRMRVRKSPWTFSSRCRFFGVLINLLCTVFEHVSIYVYNIFISSLSETFHELYKSLSGFFGDHIFQWIGLMMTTIAVTVTAVATFVGSFSVQSHNMRTSKKYFTIYNRLIAVLPSGYSERRGSFKHIELVIQ